MSQEKMDAYKAAKQNKEQIRKENKRKKVMLKTIWSIVGIVFVGLIAFLIVISVRNSKAANVADTSSPAGFGMDFMSAYVPVMDQADQYKTVETAADEETTVADETAAIETEAAETVATDATEAVAE